MLNQPSLFLLFLGVTKLDKKHKLADGSAQAFNTFKRVCPLSNKVVCTNTTG